MEEVNVYFIRNSKNPVGGNFYNVYKNSGKRLDLSEYMKLDDLEAIEVAVQKDDPSFRKIGGIILRKTELMKSASIYEPGSKVDEGKKILEELNSLLHHLNDISNELSNGQEEMMRLSKKLSELQ